MKKLVIAAHRCTGCESCVLTCGFEHDSQFNPQRSRIGIERDEENAVFTPTVCIQCGERACIEACPVDALSVDTSTGATRLSEERCIGCRRCESACRYGGVKFPEASEVPLICDLCGGDPQCILVCRFPQAIRLVEVE
jgi:carbon-monoxide dehydrogenase iron sulfur subunit